jgi:hypothetical protein
MENNPFRVFGTSTGPCLGREADKARVARMLAKNHISIVGPRYIGKTVFARNLCTLFAKGDHEITGSIYWDLGHKTPSDDDGFYSQFTAVLGKGLRTFNAESADKLEHAKGQFHDEIHDVFAYLQELGLCFLICFDSFDSLLGRGVMTRNLWDNLGALADDFKSIRYLAVSRKTLNELCWVPGSENSHFWKLFGTSPQLLKCMTEKDVEEFAAPFRRNGATIANGFIGELWNWSGGIPPIVAALARDVWDGFDGSTAFNNELVNRVAKALLDGTDTLLQELWRSFTGEQQRFIAALGEKGQAWDLPHLARPLADSQIIALQGKCWHVRSQLLRRYAASAHGQAGAHLQEFFETEEAYSRNIRTVLEFRLAHIKDMDKTLRTHLTDMVEKLDEPDLVISKPRLIANRAFELIWLREFGGYEVPAEWLKEFSRMTDKVPPYRIPSHLGGQYRILELMTDEDCGLRSHITRHTYSLINGLGPFSNTGAHLRGDRQSFSCSVAITIWCLQTVEQLSKELAS